MKHIFLELCVNHYLCSWHSVQADRVSSTSTGASGWELESNEYNNNLKRSWPWLVYDSATMRSDSVIRKRRITYQESQVGITGVQYPSVALALPCIKVCVTSMDVIYICTHHTCTMHFDTPVKLQRYRRETQRPLGRHYLVALSNLSLKELHRKPDESVRKPAAKSHWHCLKL